MDHYDTPWKSAIRHNLSQCLAFFFPDIHAAVDWNAQYCFPDHELAPRSAAVAGATLQPDVVATITLRGGAMHCLHIEVQGCRERDFARRMYAYHSRLRERFLLPVTSLAVLTDRSPSWRPSLYLDASFGLGVGFTFGVAKLLDYRDRQRELAADANPFAFLTAAHLAALQTRHSPDWRLARKCALLRQLLAHDWDGQQQHDLFDVLDWMMPLPGELQRQMGAYMHSLRKTLDKPFENCWVKYEKELARTEGLAEGRTAGLAAGEAAGRREATHWLLANQLRARFGATDKQVLPLLHAASEAQLLQLGIALVREPTLEAALSAAGLSR